MRIGSNDPKTVVRRAALLIVGLLAVYMQWRKTHFDLTIGGIVAD